MNNCENCQNYIWDDEMEYYVCDIDLDMDDMEHFLSHSTGNCPYFKFYDEYKLVRKQN